MFPEGAGTKIGARLRLGAECRVCSIQAIEGYLPPVHLFIDV